MPGMFRLAWRLIRVWLHLASAWPIRLGIIWARAVVAFAICGAFHELGVTRLGDTLLVCLVRGAVSAFAPIVAIFGDLNY